MPVPCTQNGMSKWIKLKFRNKVRWEKAEVSRMSNEVIKIKAKHILFLTRKPSYE